MGMDYCDELSGDVIFLALPSQRSFETQVSKELLKSSASLSRPMHEPHMEQ